MRTVIPAEFCRPAGFFRQCFEVDAEQCLETARRTFEACLADKLSELPEVFDVESGTHWGQVLGACAGRNYEISLADKKKRQPKCSDPGAWVP